MGVSQLAGLNLADLAALEYIRHVNGSTVCSTRELS